MRFENIKYYCGMGERWQSFYIHRLVLVKYDINCTKWDEAKMKEDSLELELKNKMWDDGLNIRV